MKQGASFSDGRRHRYALWRIWNDDKPLAMFIGLNPSTANEVKADPTITRVMRFAYDWGCGGFYMMNLFTFVTAYPSELPVGPEAGMPENDAWLEKINLECERVVFAWGAFGQNKRLRFIRDRADQVIARFPGAYCLGKTGGGHPCHPLFLPADRKFQPFITN